MMTGYDARATLIGKIVPPPPAPNVIERPRVIAALAEAAVRRVTALTAGPGFGKTTALTTFAVERNCAWYTLTRFDRHPVMLARGLVASLTLRVPGLLESLTPALDGARGPDTLAEDFVDAFVPALAGALHDDAGSDVLLVLDDLHELAGAAAAERLVADLCQMAPRRLHVVIASRSDLPFPVQRLRLQGQLNVLAAESLGFDEEETAAALVSVGEESLRPHAAIVWKVTGGWPAVVRLVAEALATAVDRTRVLADLTSRGAAVELVQDLLDSEVSGNASPQLVSLLRVGAALDSFNPALLGALGVVDAGAVIGTARRRGIHVTAAPPDGWFCLTPMSREYALSRLVSDPRELAQVRIAAARWHAERGETAAALRYLTLADDGRGIVALLAGHGSALLAAGLGAVVGEALARVPTSARTAAIDLVEGEACQVRGDWDRAVDCLSRLVPDEGPAPAAAAWRLGLIHHMRGEPERAMDLYQRGYADTGSTPGDRALAAAWGSAAAWLTGDTATCRDLADRAGEMAEAAQDSRALAATHTAWAMLAALDGDRRSNDRHYLRALHHAERAGDVLQIIRIRVNRGSRFMEEGYYAQASAELDSAVDLADLAGFTVLHGLALQNRGEAKRRLGRLDDAARDFHTALAIQQRVGSRMAAYALSGLGSVHADQGSFSLARAAYEEAVALAEPSGDVQGLVPALCGLARLVAPDDPIGASELVARALAAGTNLAHTEALLAAGWVALRRGDVDAVRRYGAAAAQEARRRRDRAGMAESLELRVVVTDDPAERRALLAEAEALWQSLACPLPLARTRLAQARLAHAQMGRSGAATSLAGAAVSLAETVSLAEVERVCRELGARALAAEAATVRAGLSSDGPPELSIRTLGGFRVMRRGAPLPHGAWQSRKARDLVKILIARRGSPVPREMLCGLLWPEVEPARAGNRLSVAISTLRSVLDADREFAADRYVVSEEGAVWLRHEHVDIDVESFLRTAGSALARVDTSALALAEEAYSGQFCEEDQYADWATALREETRAAYVAVTHALADRHAAEGEHESAVRYLLRLLTCEPYDEQAHLALVRELDATGRHGDARRMYRTYAARMAELDVQHAPYPDAPSRR